MEEDDGVRAGVVSMSHGWGGLPDDPPGSDEPGVSTNLLTTTAQGLDPINAMPVLTAIPVVIEPVPAA